MKRNIIIGITVVFLAGVILALAVPQIGGEYRAQWALGNITKVYHQSTLEDTETVPEAVVDAMINDYIKFINRYKHSSLKPIAQLYLARAYVLKGELSKARLILLAIMKEHAARPEIAVQANVEMARTFAIEGDLGNVMNMYKKILMDYPLTTVGLQTPLLISRFYEQQGMDDLADEALANAVEHYHRLAEQNNGSVMELRIRQLISNIYIAQEKWEEGVRELGGVLLKFAGSPYLTPELLDMVVKTINAVSISKLDNFDLPISLYEQVLAEHPNHPMKPVLSSVIGQLNSLREQSAGPVEVN